MGQLYYRHSLHGSGTLKKILRARGNRLRQNSICQMWQGSCTQELKVVMTACTRAARNQNSQTPNTDGQGSQHQLSWEASGNWRLLETEESSFPQGCGPWEATYTPVDGPIPTQIQTALSGFNGLTHSTWSWEGKVVVEENREWIRGEGIGGEFDQSTLICIYILLKQK